VWKSSNLPEAGKVADGSDIHCVQEGASFCCAGAIQRFWVNLGSSVAWKREPFCLLSVASQPA